MPRSNGFERAILMPVVTYSRSCGMRHCLDPDHEVVELTKVSTTVTYSSEKVSKEALGLEQWNLDVKEAEKLDKEEMEAENALAIIRRMNQCG